jgi:hypothetical protein
MLTLAAFVSLASVGAAVAVAVAIYLLLFIGR